jgi:drug/metabolite transporter, DME family
VYDLRRAVPELSSESPRSSRCRASDLQVISETTLGALASLGSAMAWAVTSLLARSLMPGLGSADVNAVRAAIGGTLLVVWVLATAGVGAFTTVSAEAWALLTLSIVVAIAIGDTVFFESTRALGLGRAMTIATTYPVGAAVIASAFLGEPLTLAIAAGMAVTLVGLILIVAPWADRPPEERFGFGVATAALASLAWAVSTVLVKPPLAEMDAVTAQAIRLPLAAVALAPWARSAPRALMRASRSAWVRIAVLSGVTSISSVMFVAGVKYAGVAVASALSSTAPMFAIPLAIVVLGERLTPRALLGATITVAGIVVLHF